MTPFLIMSAYSYHIYNFFVFEFCCMLAFFVGGAGGTAGAGGEGEEGEAGSSDGEVLVSGGAPFETHLWRARQAIQLATDAMLAAYEVSTLLGCSEYRYRVGREVDRVVVCLVNFSRLSHFGVPFPLHAPLSSPRSTD